MTSPGFDYAPSWFSYIRLALQISVSVCLIAPIRFKFNNRYSLILMFSFLSLIFLANATPVSLGENLLLYSILLNVILFSCVLLLSANTIINDDDVRFVFNLFLIGFAIQVLAYVLLNIVPSHSLPFQPRFNGLTNDSLSTGLLLPAFVPVAVTHRNNIIMTALLLVCAFLTGSFFAILFTFFVVICYMIYLRYYAATLIFICLTVIIGFFGIGLIIDKIEQKSLSVITHLRFFFNILNFDFGQTFDDCSEEFCESLIESGLHLSPGLIFIYYMGLIWLLLKVAVSVRINNSLLDHSLFALGFSLIFASIVHPIPLIPYACTIFIILACLTATKRNTSKLISHKI